jgi:hypothetical protein
VPSLIIRARMYMKSTNTLERLNEDFRFNFHFVRPGATRWRLDPVCGYLSRERHFCLSHQILCVRVE